jgi:hypothetical protein
MRADGERLVVRTRADELDDEAEQAIGAEREAAANFDRAREAHDAAIKRLSKALAQAIQARKEENKRATEREYRRQQERDECERIIRGEA